MACQYEGKRTRREILLGELNKMQRQEDRKGVHIVNYMQCYRKIKKQKEVWGEKKSEGFGAEGIDRSVILKIIQRVLSIVEKIKIIIIKTKPNHP